ncbi:MAG: hypothetical protein PHH40_01975 [Candidatus Moranbacteria bacterium]|nr:hypothetical protein [Candidatus Moranbacteria bacterium]MDD3965013.1 hypothetical protein [Candidatus Moranbacteria bacterium]
MAKIAYFIDVPKKGERREEFQWFLTRMMRQHPFVFSISKGRSPETTHFFEEHGIVVQDFWTARERGIFEFPGDQRYFLNDMVKSLPGKGLLEVLYHQKILYHGNFFGKPYTGDLILFRPITREEGDELSTALTIAGLQSLGFIVLEDVCEVTPDSITPHEVIKITGRPGQAEHQGRNAEQITAEEEQIRNEERIRAVMRKQQEHDAALFSIARTRWNIRENARVDEAWNRGIYLFKKPFTSKYP